MAATRVSDVTHAVAVTIWFGCTAVPAPFSQAQATTPCQYEENCGCRVPGITIRWKAAACMARNQTDDFEHVGVQACLAQPDRPRVRPLGACAQNVYWKREVCAATRPAAEVESCVRDPAFIPRIVARGAGG